MGSKKKRNEEASMLCGKAIGNRLMPPIDSRRCTLTLTPIPLPVPTNLSESAPSNRVFQEVAHVVHQHALVTCA